MTKIVPTYEDGVWNPEEESGGGGSLPDPFVITGTDPDTPTATVTGAAAQQEALLQLNSDDDGSNYLDVINVDTGEGRLFFVDSAGQCAIQTVDPDAIALTANVRNTAPIDTHSFVVTGGGDPHGHGSLDFEIGGKLKLTAGLTAGQAGLVLSRPHSAPSDASLNAGDVTFWFDQTDGAAKLKIKGKSADGTVVAGEVALT